MKQNTVDERVTLHPVFLNILIFVVGVSGLMLIRNTGSDINMGYVDSFILLFYGIFSGFAFYGFVSLLADIKKSNSISDFMNNFIKKMENENN